MTRVTSDPRRDLPAMVGAYFHPAQLSPFAHMPSCELTDRIVDIEDLWESAGRDLAERLAARGESERLDLLEDTLLQQMADRREAGTALR